MRQVCQIRNAPSTRCCPAIAGSAGFDLLQNTADQAQTAGAFGLLTVHDGQDRTQQLRAGRLLEHMYLWATKVGLAIQPLNAVVERADRT